MITRIKAVETLNEMPDEFDIDDLIDKMIFIDKIGQGLEDSKHNRVFSEQEAEKRLEKMVELIWTNSALQDLEDIADFISKDSQKFAGLVIRRIMNSAQKLKSLPNIGRVVPEIRNENIRELIHGVYRIVYFIKDESRIEILTVHHSAKLFHIEFGK